MLRHGAVRNIIEGSAITWPGWCGHECDTSGVDIDINTIKLELE